MRLQRLIFLGMFLAALPMVGQEANSGLELRTTLSADSFYTHQLSAEPRDGGPWSGGFRAMIYPTWKIDSHWSLAGALQIHSRPYFGEEFGTQGYGLKGDLLQLNLSYSRFWADRSLVVRIGNLSSAFGAFLPRYDAAVNPLIGLPSAYGYYDKGVTFLGLAGAQVDFTGGKLDLRAQFVNSSPANRRSIFDRDQYGNWAGGLGYTIRQGFRIGASAYRGPYLHRQYAYYSPGEGKPRDLPAVAYGLDVQWGTGHWNVWGEWQHFRNDYHAIPTYLWQTGYGEVRRVLNPRWYAAVRLGYVRSNDAPISENYEMTAGFRPGANELLKLSYVIQKGAAFRGTLGNAALLEFVISFRAFSVVRN